MTRTSLRTPLARVLGDGSAKEGVGHWWTQRITAVALVPLTVWFVVGLLRLPSLEYAAVVAWLAIPWNSAAAVLLVLTLAWHSAVGVQVVIEDYVQDHGLKVVALVLTKFAHALVGAVGVIALLRVALA
jgi:succinate dehydrogenase / fumarate reductase membrane anchor subunit